MPVTDKCPSMKRRHFMINLHENTEAELTFVRMDNKVKPQYNFISIHIFKHKPYTVEPPLTVTSQHNSAFIKFSKMLFYYRFNLSTKVSFKPSPNWLL